MYWYSCHSRQTNFDEAWAEVRASIQETLGDQVKTLIVYVSLEFRKHFKDMRRYAAASFPHATFFGASSGGLLSGDRELEEGPAIVAMAGSYDSRSHFESVYIPSDGGADAVLRAVEWHDVRGIVALCDPFSADADKLLIQIKELAPKAPIVGGILLGGEKSGDHALWTEQGVFDEGSVLLLVRGAARIAPLVSQGATPVSDPLIVMSRRAHVIDMFDAGKPIEVVRGILSKHPRSEWDRINRSIVLGIGVTEGAVDEGENFVLGEVIGVDPSTGSVAVAAVLEDFQVVRFLVRDPAAARADLSRHLMLYGSLGNRERVRAIFSFISGERGLSFFRTPNHDARSLAEISDTSSHCGIFCGSEIGPVGAQTYVQSFTATAGLLLEDIDEAPRSHSRN